MEIIYEKTDIMKLLPHRNRMLLLDRVRRSDEWACGELLIRPDAHFLDGHFPEHPIVPGVILCEILAQTACVLMEDRMAGELLPVYTGIDHVRFKSPVYPKDLFETRCRIVRTKGSFYFAEGSGTVGGRLCVTGEFSFALTEKANV